MKQFILLFFILVTFNSCGLSMKTPDSEEEIDIELHSLPSRKNNFNHIKNIDHHMKHKGKIV